MNEALLVAEVMQQASDASDVDRRAWVAAAIAALQDAFPYGGDPGEWARCQLLTPYALVLARRAIALRIARDVARELLLAVSIFLTASGSGAEATDIASTAVTLSQELHGESSPETAWALSIRGESHLATGELGNARRDLELADGLAGGAGSVALRTLECIANNLGTLSLRQGRLEEAEQRLRQAVELAENSGDAGSLAVRLNNLGAVLTERGDLRAAREVATRALHLTIEAEGVETSAVATRLYNLATLDLEHGHIWDSRDKLGKALKIATNLYGDAHEKTRQIRELLSATGMENAADHGVLQHHPFNRTSRILDQISPAEMEQVVGRCSDEKRAKVALAGTNFAEQLQRLESRLLELKEAEVTLSGCARSGQPPDELHERQLLIVDKTEAFHQHVYACIQALAMLINVVAPHGLLRGKSISSGRGFLKFVRELPTMEDRAVDVDRLRASIDFRHKQVTHPQQSKLHTWMTTSGPLGAAVVYFVPAASTDAQQDARPPAVDDPYDPDYIPPVGCTAHVVPPEPNAVLDALHDVARLVLHHVVLIQTGDRD